MYISDASEGSDEDSDGDSEGGEESDVSDILNFLMRAFCAYSY